MSCTDGTLSFSAHNTFKQNNPSEARYSVAQVQGSVLSEGSFYFTPHWRETYVNVDIGPQISGLTLNVTITNVWGDETSVATSCS